MVESVDTIVKKEKVSKIVDCLKQYCGIVGHQSGYPRTVMPQLRCVRDRRKGEREVMQLEVFITRLVILTSANRFRSERRKIY